VDRRDAGHTGTANLGRARRARMHHVGVGTWRPRGLDSGLSPAPRASTRAAHTRMHRRPLAAVLALPLLATGGVAAQEKTFQQGVEYRIEAALDEATGVLSGRARLVYTNRSPATLDSLYLHQHLNAFRPNSAWARRELEYGERRFTDLGPRDHAFERFRRVTLDGVEVRPAYPFAPDSTVAALPLAAPLPPGGTVTLVMDWDARLSTLPRRQGPPGRHHDFAQWYPRIAVYDHTGWAHHPLLPQGEFYGEFGSYDVTLDLAEDQVIGATGVAVEGDPGYRERVVGPAEPARAAAVPLGHLRGEPGSGRKRVRFVADTVHHFAWSVDPRFVHEFVLRTVIDDAGDSRRAPGIHVLYLPEDRDWVQVAARRTWEALTWMESMFGPYPWPQLTNLHRLEPGGTEFPMLVMNGSASEGLIVHEVVHQWLHGILANNEWREGWLDEGFTSFMTNWWFEERGNPGVWTATMQGLERLERADSIEVIDQPGPAFSSPRMYGAMTYSRASAVFRMLRELVGEETFRATLRAFHERHRLSHVTGRDFERVVGEVSGRDLGWFFDQWLRTTSRLDYGIAAATTRRVSGGRWETTVRVTWQGEAWMPVVLRVGTAERLLDTRERTQTVRVTTAERPEEVVLDPEWVLIDYDRSNNRVSLRAP
jgi:hypothetical protein